MCTEIFHGNCTVWTCFFALLTADTSNLTGIHHLFALIMGAAVHSHFLVVRNQLDQMSRTFGNTFATGFTCFFIYYCNAIYNMNGIKWTDLYAASKATAAICTGLCSAVWHERKHLAVFHSSINILFFRFFTGSGAFYMSYLTGSLNCRQSHNTGNYFPNRLSAYRATVYRRFTFGNCCCQTITARISTAATVISRKSFSYGNFLLINFNSKFFSGCSKKNTDEEAYCCNQNCCCYNRTNIHPDASLN